MMNNSLVWKDRKRTLFGLPFSFTRYRLTENKLIIDIGFLNRSEDEIRLYRITDITLIRSFRERIWGLGTIHCCSGDKTSPEFNISHIKNPRSIKEMLSEMVEDERQAYRVGVREVVDGYDEDVHDLDGDGIPDGNDDGDGIHH
ncbi:MAG: PH domain-containing protein [Clostridia bacterium]|nr:PH domain-containing protein [Clostridia bacterium]